MKTESGPLAHPTCPRCRGVVLDERSREGVIVDVCSACRGVWLDRGELEKLIARAQRESDEFVDRRDDTPPRGIRYRDGESHYPRDARKKRSFLESLGEIFD